MHHPSPTYESFLAHPSLVVYTTQAALAAALFPIVFVCVCVCIACPVCNDLLQSNLAVERNGRANNRWKRSYPKNTLEHVVLVEKRLCLL